MIRVEKTVFEIAQERAKEDASKSDERDDKGAESSKADFLTPYLVQFAANPASPTMEEARKARDACLDALRHRLIERANIIQRRLDDENAKFAKEQASYQRSRDHVEGADEQFEKFCQDAMFRINVRPPTTTAPRFRSSSLPQTARRFWSNVCKSTKRQRCKSTRSSRRS